MNISTIQKRKFLTNLYRIFYSKGKTPSDQDIRLAFNQYFSVNRLGEPVKSNIELIEGNATTDVTALNELMANTILNLEVLYDCIIENNQEAFNVISNMSKKVEALRAKRKELESRIDELIFANANSDGFFYSFFENFATVSNLDLGLTSGFVDLVNNNVTLPKVTSEYSSQRMNESISPTTISKSVAFNGQVLSETSGVDNYDLMFDGLTDTYWSYQYNATAPGVLSLTLEIPVSTVYQLSRISGSIISRSPCSVYLRAIPTSGTPQEIIRIKDNKKDYNRFSFSIPSASYRSIFLTLHKSEPDSIIRSSTSPYLYMFGIRELSITSEHYDESASLVSLPISIPVNDNRNLEISSVSLDVDQEVPNSGSIRYYVAPDNPNATGLTDFNWIPISPASESNPRFSSIVNLISSPIKTQLIDRGDINNYDYRLIELNSDSTNINELNPTTLPFSQKTIYRVCKLDSNIEYKQPVLMANTNCYKHYGLMADYSRSDIQLYKSLQSWVDIIQQDSSDLIKDIYTNTDSLIRVAMNNPSIGFLETRLYAENASSVSRVISKSRDDFNLSVYLNGVLIADIPSGQNDIRTEWNFIRGINNIAIAYDKSFIGSFNVDLMVNGKLSDSGMVFLDQFTYLDPIDFRRLANKNSNTFTIDNFYGSKELLASNLISNKSSIRYYSNIFQPINAIRYRADFSRVSNPTETPVLDAIRIRFKHTDIG